MRSRRGLLELDLLLLPFVQSVYAELSAAEQQVYERLLLEDDVVLLEWLKGAPVGESDLQAMIDRIRGWHAKQGTHQ